jgi:hypothetical protein
MSPSRSAVRIVASLAALLLAASAEAENAAKKLLVGDTKVEVVAKYQGEALPKPVGVLIYDFNVPASVITVDDSPAARVHRRRKDEPVDANPIEAVANQAQASFAKALLHELQQASVPASAAPGEDSAPPPNTLLVHGEFTGIDEGNKTKRVLIGFGKGASDVKAHVTVSLAAAPEPVVLLEFKVRSQSGKKPGAAATVSAGAVTVGTASVGSAAAGVTAGGVLDRAASVEADAARMAKGVAKQIVELMSSQTWAAPIPPR